MSETLWIFFQFCSTIKLFNILNNSAKCWQADIFFRFLVERNPYFWGKRCFLILQKLHVANLNKNATIGQFLIKLIIEKLKCLYRDKLEYKNSFAIFCEIGYCSKNRFIWAVNPNGFLTLEL